MKPRSIKIFLLDGDPAGIRDAQISMSTIHGITVLLPTASKAPAEETQYG